MDLQDRTTPPAGGEGTATATRTRRGRRSPGGLFWLALLLVPLPFVRSLAALAAAGVPGADVTFDDGDGTSRLPAGVDDAVTQPTAASKDQGPADAAQPDGADTRFSGSLPEQSVAAEAPPTTVGEPGAAVESAPAAAPTPTAADADEEVDARTIIRPLHACHLSAESGSGPPGESSFG